METGVIIPAFAGTETEVSRYKNGSVMEVVRNGVMTGSGLPGCKDLTFATVPDCTRAVVLRSDPPELDMLDFGLLELNVAEEKVEVCLRLSPL